MKKTIQIIAFAIGLVGLGYSLFTAFSMDKILFNQLLTSSLILFGILLIRWNVQIKNTVSTSKSTPTHKTDS